MDSVPRRWVRQDPVPCHAPHRQPTARQWGEGHADDATERELRCHDGGTTKASSLTAGITEVINPAATGSPSWSAPGAVGADAPGVVVNGCRGVFLDSRYSLTQLLRDQLVDVDGGRVLGGQGLGGRLTGRADSAVPDDHLTAVAGELSELRGPTANEF